MEEKVVLEATKLLVEILKSAEYDNFERCIKYLMNGNIPLKSDSTYVVSVQGKIVDQAKHLVDLIDSNLTRTLAEKIDELGTLFFADIYNVQEWVDVYDMYDPRDFDILSKLYKKMGEEIFLELKYKANPYEDENIQGYGDKTITFLNFKSIREYARYLVLEGLENIQIDLKAGWIDKDDVPKFDDEGYPIEEDDGPFAYDGE